MAEYLRKPVKPVTMAAICLLASLSDGLVQAVELADPTRPPASLAPDGSQYGDKPAGEPQLQSVLISPIRRIAVISGQTVALGEKFGEARVEKITETEVVLRNGQDMQVLKLFPNVEKRHKPARSGGDAEKANVKAR
jgi:MSHA biogenesis protein MshK